MDLTALTGTGKHHLEIAAGAALLKDMYSYEIRNPEDPASYWLSLVPCGSVGYRFQKSGPGFFFKTGLGFPEFLHAGTGVSF
jgi:hypothetical protein